VRGSRGTRVDWAGLGPGCQRKRAEEVVDPQRVEARPRWGSRRDRGLLVGPERGVCRGHSGDGEGTRRGGSGS
jgi:hypothetical protein